MDVLPAIKLSEIPEFVPSDRDDPLLLEFIPVSRARTRRERPHPSLPELLLIPLLGLFPRRKTVATVTFSGIRPPDLQIGFVVEIEVLRGTSCLEPLADDKELSIDGDSVLVVDLVRILPNFFVNSRTIILF